MEGDKITVVTVRVGQKPVVEEITNNLEGMKAIVGGWIEAYPFTILPRGYIICNEEGKLQGLPINRRIGYEPIAGDFFVTKVDEVGENVSLTDSEIAKVMEFF